MPTTFANTINGNPIYAARAESDKNGDRIDTTYAKLSDIPPGVTVDQTYNSSSTNPQSGTAVAGALSTINQVPASTSSDEDKVLTVNSSGNPVWAPAQGSAQVQSDWTESDTTDPSYIQNKPTTKTISAGSGISITESSNNVVISATGGGGTQVQANWAETDPADPSYIQNKPTIPAAQVNADWTASSGVAEILHKPSIPSATSDLTNDSGFITSSDVPGAQEQADWNETNSSDPAYIKNKPTIPSAITVDQTYNSSSTNPQSGTAVAGAIAGVNQVPASTASDEDKVLTVNSSGTPVWATPQGGGGSQVQSDWTESDTTDPSYIQNKPTEKSLVAGTNVAITSNSSSVTISATDTTYTAGTGIDITNNAISVETPVDVVAGPGIVIDNPDGNTMRISCDEETVLFSGDLGVSSSTSLSESWHNFDRLKVYGYVTPGGGMAAEARTIDLESAIIDNTPCPDINLSTVASWSHRSDFNIVASVPVVFSANTTVTTLNGRLMGYWSGQWQVSFNETRIHVTKIVGIHRIANN